MTTTIEKMTCTWCDADGTQKKCYRCKDACRHPDLAGDWYMKVTPNTGLLPYVICTPPPDASQLLCSNFTRVNACCSSITANPRAAPNNRSDTNGVYKWRRYGRTYASYVDRTRVCTNASSGLCYRIGPTQVCSLTVEYARACVLGWRMIAGITQAKLYISRTQPRYGCDEYNQCRYRLALVIEGEIGLTWATQISGGQNITVNSSGSFCGESYPCSDGSGPNGAWPVGSPPAFNAASVSVTMHQFRQVFRRSVDTLEFPMTFDGSNGVGVSCGPQCAASIGSFGPTFGDPPAFICDPPDDIPGDTGFDTGSVSSCTAISCADQETYCTAYSNIMDHTSYRNTLTGSSDSGVVTPGSLPDPTLPTSYLVELE